eukprot:TRINITY_DN17264_c0_g1_i1.p1 TRINITY_DN17264_c0_g1~~TRINITY_DN17264_c0_g1_i1.p1  ORF type:complete len:106 (-),score=1.65 TRINITY_DN17264_c0_g1_i1:482-799(-)
MFSLDRTWWMKPSYSWLASTAPFPDNSTIVGKIAIALDSFRRYFDNYMGVHQFTCQNIPIMSRDIPFRYPGVTEPQIVSWCDLISDLSHPFNYFADQLESSNDYK